MMRAIRLFLARHPRVRQYLRSARRYGRRLPVFGRIVARFESQLLSQCATERYDAHDPAEAHEYFESYADWLLPRVTRGAVLDLGAGYGFLTHQIALKHTVRSVTAIDKLAPQEFRFGNDHIDYLQRDIAALNELPGIFDAIIATEFIEHISEEDCLHLVMLVRNHLKQGGVFLGSTPEDEGTQGPVSPFHLKEYTRSELEKILRVHFNQVFIEKLSSGCLVWEASL